MARPGKSPAPQRTSASVVLEFERILRRIGVEQHVDLGMERLEPANTAHEPGRGEGGARIDDEEAPSLGLAHRPHGARERREGLGEARGAGGAQFGQGEPAAGTLDQRGADLLLEKTDLLRDRSLGHMQLLGRAGEGELSSHGFEGAHRVERRQSVRRSHSMVLLSFISINFDLRLLRMPLYPRRNKRDSARARQLEDKMSAYLAGWGNVHTDFGFSGVVRVCKQILNAVSERATVATDRSRFAALPARYLDDVGLTAAERASALGCDETTIDPWRVVASHL